MEYYFHSSIGMVAIIPRPGLPSAVELRINGEFWAFYPSADEAAKAVASSTTGHSQLDALASWNVPVLLSCWNQSVPHHFQSDTPQPTAQPPARTDRAEARPELTANLAL